MATPEQIELRRERSREYQRNLTPEQRERKREKDRRRYAPERKAVTLEANREYMRKRNSTPEGKARIRRRELQRKYGLTPEQWDQMFAQQGSRCAICGTTEPGSNHGWATDHCHASGRVRAILCAPCNLGLGLFKDNPNILRAAIDYLATAEGSINGSRGI